MLARVKKEKKIWTGIKLRHQRPIRRNWPPKIISNGKLTPDNTQRIFAAEIQLPAAISGLTHVGVNCSAPANQFAFLDQEGKTYVHTTLYGTCKAMVTKMDEKGEMSTTKYKSKGQNLLEIKA